MSKHMPKDMKTALSAFAIFRLYVTAAAILERAESSVNTGKYVDLRW